MPITNLAIQRRRLRELHQLSLDEDLELFNIELSTASYYGPKHHGAGHEFFTIHARKITPQNLQKLEESGFEIHRIKRMNNFTLIVELYKYPPERKTIK